MKISLRFFCTLSILSLISSCSYLQNFAPKASFSELDTVDNSAKLDVKSFFNGDLEGFAISQDQNGKITGTNTIKINGSWEGNKGVVQEVFIYNGGKKDSRTWLITLEDDGTFDAVGHNVSSPAKGRQVGNAAQMIYSLLIPTNGVKEEVKFEDKMYLVDDKSMIKISSFKKGYTASGKNIISLKKVTK
jgi:hypothetical protein